MFLKRRWCAPLLAVGAIGMLYASEPFRGQWMHIPGVPSGCQVMTAVAPRTALPPLKWRSCASGRPGCREMVIDWTTERWRPVAFPTGEHMLERGEHTYLLYQRNYPQAIGSFGAFQFVIEDIDHGPVFALGQRLEPKYGCGITMGIGATGTGIVVESDAAVDATTRVRVVAWSTWDIPTKLRTRIMGPKELELGDVGSIPRIAVGPSSLALMTHNPGGTALLDSQTGVLKAFHAGAELLTVTNDGTIVFDSSRPPGISILTPAGEYRTLVSPASGRSICCIAVDQGEHQLVWVETSSDLDSLVEPEVWVTHLVGTGQAHRIGSLHTSKGIELIAVHGIAVVTTEREAGIIRLSDGVRWNIHARADEFFAKPIWIDAAEVWIATAANSGGYESGLIRVRRAFLKP